ncbi:sigma factor [Saccharothrix sp. BKS2]
MPGAPPSRGQHFRFRLTASWAAAEDHLQNTFLVAWRKRDRLRLEHDSALPWLLAAATNVVRGDRRTIARRLRLFRRFPVEVAVPDHADQVAERVDDQRRMAVLLAAVGDCPATSGRRRRCACGRGCPTRTPPPCSASRRAACGPGSARPRPG